MPRKQGGHGRTGSKHKKPAKFDVHRKEKSAEVEGEDSMAIETDVASEADTAGAGAGEAQGSG